MAIIENSWLEAKVHHKRFAPKVNQFSYKAYFMVLDMDQLHSPSALFSVNKANLLSYRDKDHGLRKKNHSATAWAKSLFAEQKQEIDQLFLLSMPRVLGYLFNPVSFWFGIKNQRLVGVIAEVNNTFNQTHSYICIPKDNQTIEKECWFWADKCFHVSPFYKREGAYRFNFHIGDDGHLCVKIHYYIQNQLQLITSIKGKRHTLSTLNTLKSFVFVPFLTIKVISLIHYQALIVLNFLKFPQYKSMD